MEKTYRTKEIASIIGVHPNTVRFYEEQGLLPPVPRADNGYRVYTGRHLMQLRLIRLALRAEILSDNLRREAIDIIKTAAAGDAKAAARKTERYKAHLRDEIANAHEAIALAKQLLDGTHLPKTDAINGRQEAAGQVGVSVDVLRDWERNGLIGTPGEGGRRRYDAREIHRLKIIAILRRANYSQMSIRRMLKKLERGETDLLTAIDTPEATEDIVSVADRYITSLTGALVDAEEIRALLADMK